MGVGTRIRHAVIRRLGASYRDLYGPTEEAVGKTAPPSYIGEIVKDKINDRNDRVHQRKMALYSAIGNNIVVNFAKNIWDDDFEFVDNDGNVIMQDIHDKMRDLNFLHYATQTTILERMYGHGWLFCGPEKLSESALDTDIPRIANLDYFGPEVSKVIEYDKYGKPKTLEVKVLKGIAPDKDSVATKEEKIEIDVKDLILFCTRPKPYDRSFGGLPVLDPVWTTMIGLEYAMNSSDFYLAKIGHGMYVITTPKGLGDAKTTRLEKTMIAGSVTRTVVLNRREVEEIKFVNATGSPINFPAEIDSRLGIIASGVGIPKDVLIGLSAGSITGSEVNIKLLYQTLNQHQTSFDNVIRQAAKKFGAKNNDYNIRFITRYAHDEEQKSRIKMNDAQALAIRANWLTTNEVRELDGYEPKDGGDELVSNNMEIAVTGFQTEEEAEATRNPEGKNT